MAKDDINLQNPLNDKIPKKSDKKKDKKKKGGFPVIAVIALLLVIGSIVALLVFDLFAFRETYIMPYLRNAPLIGPMFPAPEGDENMASLGRYAGMDNTELVSVITALEYQVQAMELNEATTREQIARLNDTISYLRGFESQIEAYRQVKAEFDQMIALGDSEAYIKFFETISPENAERLYEEALRQVQYDEDFRRYAATFASMDAGEAASALTNLLTTNSALLVRILWAISIENRAEIFNEMLPNNVSRIARLMEPEQPDTATAQPVATAPPLPANAPVTTETTAVAEEEENE
jgi:flagellar motility protein MotE (MotC chaperone)